MRTCLIVANQSLASPTLAEAVAERVAAGGVQFHIVVPATPITHGLTWSEDETTAAAQARLDEALRRLRELGATAGGEVGSPDPIAAALDTMRSVEVDEIILSTLPPGISRWLGQDVPTRLRKAVEVPVTVVTTPAGAAAQRAS